MITRRCQPWLGTLVEIVAEGDDAGTLVAASGQAFARIAAVHAQMSFQSAESVLSRVNREAQHDWAALTADLAAVFAAVLDFAGTSDGLFDPSVGGWLTESGRLPHQPGFPSNAAPDWRAIELDGDRVRYARPLLVDLSGIAKGYAVDLALASLRDAGLTAATVNAGGDLARFGKGATPLYVRLPQRPTHTLRLAELKDGAAATSAGYFQPDMLRHPHTGETLCARSSISVLAANCMTADALTKIVAAAPARASRVLARYGAQAIMLDGERTIFGDVDGWHDLPLEHAA